MDDTTKQREVEKQRIGAAIDEYAEAIKARMFQKVDEGYNGWDEPGWMVGTRLHTQLEKALSSRTDVEALRRYADLGAFTMMAWKRHK